MKKHLNIILTPAVIALLALIVVFPSIAYADENVIITAKIPVSVTVTGVEGTDSSDIPRENYTFRLETADESPLPENNTITISGEGSDFFLISYERVGVYHYTLKQDVLNLSNANGSYDDTIYNVTVTITNTEDGYGASVSAYRIGTENKCDIIYNNSYDYASYDNHTTGIDTSKDNPNTGDSTNIMPYVALILASLTGCIMIIQYARTNHIENDSIGD